MARQIQRQRMKRRRTDSGSRRKAKRVKRTNAYDSFNFHSGTNPQNAVVYRGIGLPDKLTTNLVYTDSIVLDPVPAAFCPYFVVSMNDAFDPQQALGGGQPTYFDQLAAVYGRYMVNGAKLTAVFSRSSGTTANIGPYICGITCSTSPAPVTSDAGSLIAAPNTTFKVVNDQDGSQSVVATYSAKNTFPFIPESIQARTTASPSQKWYGNIFASPQGTDVDTPINCVFVLEMNVTFDQLTSIIDV